MSLRDIRKPHLQQFYRDQQGKDYITYPGLLAEFHLQNDQWMAAHPDEPDRRSIKAMLVQVPNESNGNVAICTSIVVMSSGAEYGELADAAPNNVGPLLKNALPRMASTRCKGRALRDATNIGTTMYEELSDAEPTEHDDGEPAHDAAHGTNVREFSDTRETDEPAPRASNFTPTGARNPRPTRPPAEPAQRTGGASTDSQLAAIRNLSRESGEAEQATRADYPSYALAAARIEELQSVLTAKRQGAPR